MADTIQRNMSAKSEKVFKTMLSYIEAAYRRFTTKQALVVDRLYIRFVRHNRRLIQVVRQVMSFLSITAATILFIQSQAISKESSRIVLIESDTPTEALLAKPGTYLGEKFLFEQSHSGDVRVKIGIWEAGAGESIIKEFPFTEYVLMISGRVIVTEEDGASMEFVAGDTFVIPKGWSGTWDVKERMKKQIVRIGSASL